MEHCHYHEHDHGHAEHVEIGWKKLARLIAGAVLLAVGIWLAQVWEGYLPLAAFIPAYLLLGGDVLWYAARNIVHGKIFDENFLMALATIGAFAIGEYAEAVGVMLFYQLGELFQDMAVRKSEKTIVSLMDLRPDYANLQVGGELRRVAPESVQIGDCIVVKPGEKIPLDGIVTAGEAMLDTAALTGEPVPRRASVGDTVLPGCVSQNGVLSIRVTQTFGEGTTSKILELVKNATEKKAPTERFITKFARYYTPAVVGLAAGIVLVPPLLFGGLWSDWLSRGLIFLVISCPCALVVSIPLGFFGGIGSASRKGILIKGGEYLEALNQLDIVVFDKTGTLTAGVFEVTAVLPSEGYSEAELLETAAYAEAFSTHPIALSILRAYGEPIVQSGLREYCEIAGQGVRVNRDGKTILAGSRKLMDDNGIAAEERDGGTVVHVAADGVLLGHVLISDTIKPDSRRAITALRQRGVRKIVMLTGDNEQVARAIAGELQLDEVHGSLLPHEKVERVQELIGQKQAGGKLAFVGDGINDAPVLAMADIGVAMGGLGSDAAIAAADVVLMNDEPSKLSTAVDVAHFTKRIVWQNIIFALGIKAIFLALGALGVASMWEAVFADVGVALLAVLNAMRAIRYGGKNIA